MIVELLVNLITALVKVIFFWINLPRAPQAAKDAISTYFDMVFNNLGFINFFVNISTLKTIAISAIAIITFVKLYKISMWIYHKLPISSNQTDLNMFGYYDICPQ